MITQRRFSDLIRNVRAEEYRFAIVAVACFVGLKLATIGLVVAHNSIWAASALMLPLAVVLFLSANVGATTRERTRR